MSDETYGVLGATGQQGGAVADALLERGARVRAVVRDTGSERSRALAARGVELVEGDLDRPETLGSAFEGLAALFLMFTFTGEGGTQGEVQRGTAVADAAVRAGVPRVVYSSVGGAERHSGIPHFESKRRIEKHLEGVLPAVFVRPVYFMDNLAEQLDPSADEVVIRMPMPGDVPLQLVAVRDIGRVAAAALLDPDALGGAALEIAGDELTGTQIAAAVGARYGKPARYEQVPLDALGDDSAADDIKAMFRWFVDTPAYWADLTRTRAVDPAVLDLAAWLAARPG